MARCREPWEYWDDYCEEENEYEEHCPVCDRCGEKITDETYYDLEGRILHEECMTEECMKWTDDFVRKERERRMEDAQWRE